jgi:hypothetical protein
MNVGVVVFWLSVKKTCPLGFSGSANGQNIPPTSTGRLIRTAVMRGNTPVGRATVNDISLRQTSDAAEKKALNHGSTQLNTDEERDWWLVGLVGVATLARFRHPEIH